MWIERVRMSMMLGRRRKRRMSRALVFVRVTFKMKMQIDCAGEGDSVGDAGGGSGERLDDNNNLGGL